MRSLVLLTCLLITPGAFGSSELSVHIIEPREGEVFDPGGTARFVVAVGNEGPDAAMNVSLRLSLPIGLRIVSILESENVSDRGQWRCIAFANQLRCARASLPPSLGASRVSVRAQLPPDKSGGRLQAQVSVTSDTPDPGGRPNDDTGEIVIFRTFPVATNADRGSGSLRQAIDDVNAQCGFDLPCKITFDDAVEKAIEVQTPLPAIERCGVVIEGRPGTALGTLRIEISGAALDRGNGLELRANCYESLLSGIDVRRLAISGFPGNGILVSSPPDGSTQPAFYAHRISECFIGTDVTGEVARPNGLRGIAVFNELSTVFATSNILSGNQRSGLFVWSSHLVSLQGNFIGLSRSRKPLANGASGVFIRSGDLQVTGNVIAENVHFGVAVSPTARTAYIAGNSIFSNSGGGIDWGLDGPSPMDADELDGIPNAPTLIDAVYDPALNQTIVRGTLRSNGARWGPFYTVTPYFNRMGDQGEGEICCARGRIVEEGIFERDFTIALSGDFRGAVITTTTTIARGEGFQCCPPSHTSEFSNGVRVQ